MLLLFVRVEYAGEQLGSSTGIYVVSYVCRIFDRRSHDEISVQQALLFSVG